MESTSTTTTQSDLHSLLDLEVLRPTVSVSPLFGFVMWSSDEFSPRLTDDSRVPKKVKLWPLRLLKVPRRRPKGLLPGVDNSCMLWDPSCMDTHPERSEILCHSHLIPSGRPRQRQVVWSRGISTQRRIWDFSFSPTKKNRRSRSVLGSEEPLGSNTSERVLNKTLGKRVERIEDYPQ